jgi:hypothetical protein
MKIDTTGQVTETIINKTGKEATNLSSHFLRDNVVQAVHVNNTTPTYYETNAACTAVAKQIVSTQVIQQKTTMGISSMTRKFFKLFCKIQLTDCYVTAWIKNGIKVLVICSGKNFLAINDFLADAGYCLSDSGKNVSGICIMDKVSWLDKKLNNLNF